MNATYETKLDRFAEFGMIAPNNLEKLIAALRFDFLPDPFA